MYIAFVFDFILLSTSFKSPVSIKSNSKFSSFKVLNNLKAPPYKSLEQIKWSFYLNILNVQVIAAIPVEKAVQEAPFSNFLTKSSKWLLVGFDNLE